MNELEQKLEAFLNQVEREAYEVGAGLKDEASFTAIYENFPGLFSEESLRQARDIPAGRGRDTALSFLTVNIIENALKETTDKLLTEELNATIDVDGKPVPFRQAQVLISNEKSPEGRRTVDAARRAAQLKLNPLYEDLHERARKMTADMGYSSYSDFFEKLEGLQLAPIREQTDALLKETEAHYKKLLARYSAELLNVDNPSQCDMVYMRRAPQFDRFFPAEPMVPATWKTLSAMGISAESNPRIKLDIEHRDKKSPRAFCSPVRVPDEVYLVIMPHGGSDDYSSFLHELGHTLHFAHTAEGLPVAARFLGDNSVTEAHAGLIERLAVNPLWLADALGEQDYSEYIRFSEFFELYMLRRYSAKLKYEMELHGGKHALADCPAIYADILSSATLVEYSPDDYLRDVDPHFYCVRYLRSWMLERQMRRALETRFGPRWFNTPGAGELLLSLWAKGQSENADAISSGLGFGRLDMRAIIDCYSA